MTRVMIVDDHALIREALARSLGHAGFDVVAEAADGEQAVRLTAEERPDVVVMDLSLPVMSGLAATKRICAEVKGTRVLVLSMLSDEVALEGAVAAGASGFVVKDATTDEIAAAVTAVAEGRRVFPDATDGPQEAGTAKHDDLGSFEVRGAITRREEEVLRVMATGVSIQEAARQLYISQKTLKNHLASIYAKLDTHDRAQAVLKAVRMGLINLH